jgi:hypothetical protein
MNSVRFGLFALSLVVLSTIMLFAGVEDLSAQSNPASAIDAVVEVYLAGTGDNAKCATDPDTLFISKRHLKGQSPVIAFLAARSRITISQAGQFERLVLNSDVFGTYQYTVTCDGIPDAPPAIIVDR